MCSFAVLAQALAMVATQDDDRVLIQPLIFQKLQQPANLFVSECDFPVIGMGCVFVRVRLRWAIRKMRIVQMHPEEKLLPRILAKPLENLISYQIAGTLHFVEVRFVQTAEVEMIV